jgi:hypothetical protein
MAERVLKAGMTPLFLPVPPMFEKSLGYKGESRFVAFTGNTSMKCFFTMLR